MKEHFKFALLLGICLFSSGCYLIDAMQPTAAVPEKTATSLINLAILPTLPTLPPEATQEATPEPESNIYYDSDASVFAHLTEQPVSSDPNQSVMLIGTVSDYTGLDFSVTNNSGDSFTVDCDDYCFYVDNNKNIISANAIQNGGKVAVFGVTDDEDSGEIHADAIVIDGIVKTNSALKPDSISLPVGMDYAEYELASPPLAAPLRLQPVEGSLEENLANRKMTSLSNRTTFSYGYYGETYTTGLEYAGETNRDPDYPTRANMTVYSNGYEFFNFWFPHVSNPLFYTWGIVNYGGDWYLPIRMTVDINPDPAVTEIIYSDRTIMSQLNFDKSYDYLRTFGFSIINYNLFYFYQQTDGYGISINRTNYPLGFDEIIFGMVGDNQDLNPYYADTLITFFGLRGDTWYYVEINAPEETYY